jgi:four helix bundle protein
MTSIQNFRTYDLAISFYKSCKQIQLPYSMKDQLMRAASSISLNLGEGSAKFSKKERIRYYSIAFASIREVQTIIELEGLKDLHPEADRLAASLYRLVHQK